MLQKFKSTIKVVYKLFVLHTRRLETGVYQELDDRRGQQEQYESLHVDGQQTRY